MQKKNTNLFKHLQTTKVHSKKMPVFKCKIGVVQIAGSPMHKCQVILTPRPSRILACNIEKLGWAWVRGCYLIVRTYHSDAQIFTTDDFCGDRQQMDKLYCMITLPLAHACGDKNTRLACRAMHVQQPNVACPRNGDNFLHVNNNGHIMRERCIQHDPSAGTCTCTRSRHVHVYTCTCTMHVLMCVRYCTCRSHACAS